MRRALIGISAAAALALGSAAVSASNDPWDELRRPLQIPRIAPGSPCPASEPNTTIDLSPYGVGQGFGPGPAYPMLGPPIAGYRRASLVFDYPPSRGSPLYGRIWGGQKALWFLLPGYGDRVLIRGRQLDGPYRVRFGFDDLRLGRGALPADEERLVVANDRRDFPSTTRLRTGGCYGYQIDGPNYSRVIVFKTQLRCLAVRVHGVRLKAGPFTGLIRRAYDVVDGRFRLHVGPFRDRASGLNQRIEWFVSREYRVGSGLIVRGTRLAPPGDSFRQFFRAGRSRSPDHHVFRSKINPPSPGCWRFSLQARQARTSFVVLVTA
jgi:hypothetical protein